MPRFRIGLVGAGWVTAHHLTAYAELGDRARVVAIADPDAQALSDRADRFGIPGRFTSLEAMLDRTELDAIDIASPREHHPEACRLAAARGLPILCQKPLAPTLAEARALVAGLPADTRLMVHENWRFRPHYRRIADWIGLGRIGPVRQVLLRALTSGLLPDASGRRFALDRQPMMARLERMLLMEVLIHHVDTLRFLLGDLELRSATLGRDCPAIRGEDRATLVMQADDVPVVLMGDFMAHGHPQTLHDDLEIIGRDGAIRLKGDRLRLHSDGKLVEDLHLDLDRDYIASYAATIRHFLDAVAAGTVFETAPEDNLKTLEIIETAYGMSRPPPRRDG